MPPWPLQVPLPVEVLVVPSLQVVGAGSAAMLGIANTHASKGAAKRPATVIFFMKIHSLVLVDRRWIVDPIFAECDQASTQPIRRQNADDFDDKARVLALGHAFHDIAVDQDVRTFADAVREFGQADQLHVVCRQTVETLGRGINVLRLVQDQYGHGVDAVRAGKLPKMNPAHEIVPELQPLARAAADDAAGKRNGYAEPGQQPQISDHSSSSFRVCTERLALHIHMIDAGGTPSTAQGSRDSTISKPDLCNSSDQLSTVRKYQGAGSLKSLLNPCQLPARQPSS